MSELPSAVLSERFEALLEGKRVLAAVFTTFRLEPAFFETEVLPVFLQIPLSHAPAIKLAQLELAIRESGADIAVYYDSHGLVPDGGSAKLDVARYPIHRHAIFHPKNVFVLLESIEPNDDERREKSLLVACSSANLTRAGWWENLEAAHIEVIGEEAFTSIGEDAAELLDSLVRQVEGQRVNDGLRAQHVAANKIRAFLKGTSPRLTRSVDGRMLTHLHYGNEHLADFIADRTARAVKGWCLEIVSPYFDDSGAPATLEGLLDAFEPREARIFLPENDEGGAECTEAFANWVEGREELSWGTVPDAHRSLGTVKGRKRTVHAKIYRFFEPKRGGREIVYVGSSNLTTAGWAEAKKGGNAEAGFLVEVTSSRKPAFFLERDERTPTSFAPRSEDEGIAASGGTKLVIRFDWNDAKASAYWADKSASPPLEVRHGGVVLFEVPSLEGRTWTDLSAASGARLAEVLLASSVLEVLEQGAEPAFLLVQEVGMAKRPSVIRDLTAAEILRFWALLTTEQRGALLGTLGGSGGDDPLTVSLPKVVDQGGLFDRFAGIFHAFQSLETHVVEALEKGNEREADYRLFGVKFDSLGTLVGRVLDEAKKGDGDTVEHYLVVQSAKQLLVELKRGYADYFTKHDADWKILNEQLASGARIRDVLAAGDPQMLAFLQWFDDWFAPRATAIAEEA